MSGYGPENEAGRLAALKRYDLLDTPPEAVFDGITRLLAQQLDVPIALVSLIDETRQWFKSRFGVEASETPREFAFCAHAIQGDDIMVVEDATKDSRFATNPLVTGQPGVRFYAGAPLRTADGYNLGTLSAVDLKPRTLADEQRRVLADLSRIVVDVMEMRRTAKSAVVSERSAADSAELRSLDMQRERRTSEAQFASILDIAHDAIVSVDERQRICLFNQGAEATFGYAAEEILGEPLDILIPERFRSRHRDHMKGFSLSGEASRLMNRRGEVVGLRKDGTEFPAIASVSKLALDDGTIFTVMLRDVTDRVAMENALRENEARFRDFAGAASDSFWEHNENLEFTFSTLMKNPAHTSELDLIGKTRWRLAGADADGDPHWRQHRETLEAHRSFRDFEYSLTDARGNRRHLSASGVPVFDNAGTFKGYRGSAQDVTERVNAAAILRESEERFRNLVEGSIQGVLVTRNFRPLFANDAAAALFGFETTDDLLALESVKPLIASDEQERIKGITEARLRGDSAPAIYEFQGVRKDGSRRWFEVRVSLVDWDKDTASLTTIVDVTDRRNAERALSESEERLRNIIQNSPSTIFLKDREGRCTLVNQQSLNWIGRSEEDVLGTTAFELFPEPLAREMVEEDRLVLENGRTIERVMEMPFEDGEARTISFVKFPVRGANGETTGIGVIGTDITERQHAESAVRERESLLRDIIDQMPALISLKDTGGRYVLTNRRFSEINDVDADAIIGKTSFDLGMSDADARALVELDRKVLETGAVQTEERKVATSSGPYDRYVRKFPVYASSGAISGVGTVSVDLSDRKAMEEQLRQAQKMEAVGQLTGGIAHDFNNLLGIIVGNLGLLKDTLPQEGEQCEFVDFSLQAARQGAELTNRLLAYSRKQPLRPVVVDLNEVVHGIVDLLRRTLGETIAVRTVAPADLGKTEIDPGQLEAALLNLAVNARHAMPAGGQLTMETENFEVGPNSTLQELATGRYVTLSVSDTGTGMSPEILEHVFEPFFTTKGVGEGSGLGLSMVFGFVKQSGGHISIDSVEGHGTTVRLYFPASGAADLPLADSPTTGNVPHGAGETVLVVEDDDRLRAVAVRILTGLGYNTLTAADGPAALALLDEGVPADALFTDIVLPRGMNGIALAKAALTRRPGLRVLYTSGYANDAVSDRDPRETELDLLDKPYSRDDLAHRLRRVLDRR